MIEQADAGNHPEELITLALAGNLDESQWRTLRSHLVDCRPCATQMRLAGWTSQDTSESLAASHLRDRVTVSRVLDIWESEQAPRRFPLVPRWAVIGGTLLGVSGVAMASSWLSGRPSEPPIVNPSLPTTQGVGPSRARPKAPVRDVSKPVPDNSSVASPEGALALNDAAPKPPEQADVQPTAALLFARGSELRLKGDSAGAIATFRRLQQLYPESRESQTSHLVMGRVWLDKGHPELAAPEFGRYLKSGGAASEEALVGHAKALRRMGQSSAEAADWTRLLDKYPGSLYAAEARKRLGELQHQRTEAPRDSRPP